MDALQQMMNNPWNRTRDSKKRWRTVCRNDTRASAGAQQHQGLVAYMRPQTWMLQPLDLSTDVVTMIVEALMCSDDLNKARTIKALALVNRLYAAAVAFTLNQVRAQLQRNANDLALVQKRQLMLNRACVDGESVGEEAHAHIAAEVIRRNGVHCQYMTSVGIPSKRRGTLLRFADRTRFHDNRSLLGHMEGGCELCGNPHGRMATGDAFIRDGPVVLVACEECKGKHCVNLTLQYADETGELLKVNIEQEETEANNYAARQAVGTPQAHVLQARLAHVAGEARKARAPHWRDRRAEPVLLDQQPPHEPGAVDARAVAHFAQGPATKPDVRCADGRPQ